MTGRGYDFWLLDLDGTIVDVEWTYVRRQFDRVGDRLGRHFEDRDAEALWYGFGGERDRQLDRLGVDRDAFWSAFDAVEDPAARLEATTLYPDAARFLEDLDAPLGVVTHCRDGLARAVLERHDIADRFGTVVSCSDGLGWKPDPAPVRRAMRDLSVNGEHRGVLVGDGENDVGAAWNAGLDGVHVERHDPDRRGMCVLGDYTVGSLDELAPLIPAEAR